MHPKSNTLQSKYSFLGGKKARRLYKITVIAFVFWLLSFGVVSHFLLSGNPRATINHPDYVVILGAGLDGNLPGLTLEKRLETGLSYLQAHPELPVIVTGGQGSGETVSEAQAMFTYLHNHGIREERILMENKSQSTMENFLFTSRLLEEAGAAQPVPILIVTSDFHLFRAGLLAQRNGFIYGNLAAPTPHDLLLRNLFREYFALIKSLMLDHV